MSSALHEQLHSTSFLEHAFLRWVLTPACWLGVAAVTTAQREVAIGERSYRVDYAIKGTTIEIAIELDGFAYHSDRNAFTYDRMRQNDLQSAGFKVLRFSYDGVRLHTERCVEQLQVLMRQDALLSTLVRPNPLVVAPDMDPDPLYAATRTPAEAQRHATYFDRARQHFVREPLRGCQREAFMALSNYYASGGHKAACVMSVGAGKTALGVAATLAFAHRRALIITPGNVIRSTFDRALDSQDPKNVLYNLPEGPLLPGCPPPNVLTISAEGGPNVTREQLLAADIVVTNFHALGDGSAPNDLIAKLGSADIDFMVVDEAHIAAAASYQRAFAKFKHARTLLMSACFQRLDGKPIDVDVVYRYRLIDSIADGHAKNLRVTRFEPDPESSVYELRWPDGRLEEIRGRDAVLSLLEEERKLALVTAKSEASIRRIMRATKAALERQAAELYPVKPRALMSALGERHAVQISRLANDAGIPTDYLHHQMGEARIRSVKRRFEEDSGDLQGVVHLKMLGQGYDFPSISVVVPLRPYGSFGEFYQFIGRGVRTVRHQSLASAKGINTQYVDIIVHTELGLEVHLSTLCEENDMDPVLVQLTDSEASAGSHDRDSADEVVEEGRAHTHIEFLVTYEQGELRHQLVHDTARIAMRQREREQVLLAQRYAEYVQKARTPVSFEVFCEISRRQHSA